MDLDKLELFIYTVEEYKRFAKQLPKTKITDLYDEGSYIIINTKLILLRKYGCYGENVYIKTIIDEMIEKFPSSKEKLEKLESEFVEIEKQQLEYILPDGTKLNIYQTIEDVMYGIYLHADANRIKHLKMTEEGLRFVCVRKYVEELEKVVLDVYEILKDNRSETESSVDKNKAPIIYLGDTSKNKQLINNSPYWSNLYGKDGTDEELKEIVYGLNNEDLEILQNGLSFLNGLEENDIDKLDSLILPSTKRDWKNYIEAQTFYSSLKNPGISTKVRYNEKHNMASIRIFQRVDDLFIINTPHIIDDIYELNLIKTKKGEWKIYSMYGKQ